MPKVAVAGKRRDGKRKWNETVPVSQVSEDLFRPTCIQTDETSASDVSEPGRLSYLDTITSGIMSGGTGLSRIERKCRRGGKRFLE